MISFYSAEVSTLYPLGEVFQKRSPTPNGKPVHLLKSTSASFARAKLPTTYSTKPEPIWPATVHGSYWSPSLSDIFEPGRRPLTSEGSTMTFFIPPIKTIRGTTWSHLNQGTSHPGSTPCPSRGVF